MYSEQDKQYMKRALQIAELGGVHVAPNPKVGAVIVHKEKIIGEGYHAHYGEAHAEVNAVKQVKNQDLLSSATIYVTLEPCSHFGKTPPCADLIVKHSFKRVVVACQDSFAAVSGNGIRRMRDAGIQVDVGLFEKEAQALNRRFFTYHEAKRPYVILKWAQTRDRFIDRTADTRVDGVNWITHPHLKTIVHKWRSEEQAIMVGVNTVINDNPLLDVRLIDGPSPHRFIVDPECKTPLTANVIADGKKTSLIVKKNKFETLPSTIEVIELETFSTPSILGILYDKGINSVFIEGGAYTLQQFIETNLWDETRILEGDTVFKEGIPAPQLNSGTRISTSIMKGNVVSIYRNL